MRPTMTRLEELTTGTRLSGLSSSGIVTVESVQWIDRHAQRVIFRSADSQLGEHLLYRDDEVQLELVESGSPWSFDDDGDLLRLVSESYCIKLDWLFDPYVAITTSTIMPLPHQISVVYQSSRRDFLQTLYW